MNFVTALTKLLSNPALRKSFEADANMVADLLNLTGDHKQLFTSLSVSQINSQAKLLVTKRLREVHKFLPHTFQYHGKNIATHFPEYAIDYWPNAIQRHLEDAFKFCEYMQNHKLTVNQTEFNRVHFLQSKHRLGLRFTKDLPYKGSHYPALQFFYKRKQYFGEWRLFLRA